MNYFKIEIFNDEIGQVVVFNWIEWLRENVKPKPIDDIITNKNDDNNNESDYNNENNNEIIERPITAYEEKVFFFIIS